MKLPKPYVRLTRSRNFLLFLLNCALGSLGQGLTYISVAWMSQHEGASLGAMALVMLGFWAPSIILALPIGTFIDKGNERLAAVIANGMRGLALVLVAVLGEEFIFNRWQLFILALTLGSFNAFYSPAIGVLMRKIVRKKDLLCANSLGDGCVEFFSILGMGTCGFILSFIGPRSTLLLSGVLFIGAALCFTFFKKSNFLGIHKEISMLERIPWAQLLKTPRLPATYIMSGILFFLMMSMPVLLAPYVKSLSDASLKDFSLLEACFSIGAVMGALLVPYFVNKNMALSLYTFWTKLALALFCFALFPNNFSWHASYLIIGMCIATWAVVYTEVQRLTPIIYQGRLLAYNNAVWGGLVFITFFLSHAFGDSTVIRSLYLGCAFLALALIVIFKLAFHANTLEHHEFNNSKL